MLPSTSTSLLPELPRSTSAVLLFPDALFSGVFWEKCVAGSLLGFPAPGIPGANASLNSLFPRILWHWIVCGPNTALMSITKPWTKGHTGSWELLCVDLSLGEQESPLGAFLGAPY